MHRWVYMQGYEAGLILGREEAREGIRQEGLQEGQLAVQRWAVEIVMTTRGRRLTARRRAQIAAEARPKVLRAWLQRACTAPRAGDVFGRGA